MITTLGTQVQEGNSLRSKRVERFWRSNILGQRLSLDTV